MVELWVNVYGNVCALISERGVRYFPIDSFNPMLLLHGCDIGSTLDVERFWRGVADPIWSANEDLLQFLSTHHVFGSRLIMSDIRRSKSAILAEIRT